VFDVPVSACEPTECLIGSALGPFRPYAGPTPVRAHPGVVTVRQRGGVPLALRHPIEPAGAPVAATIDSARFAHWLVRSVSRLEWA
jgi:hypothetical protein